MHTKKLNCITNQRNTLIKAGWSLENKVSRLVMV